MCATKILKMTNRDIRFKQDRYHFRDYAERCSTEEYSYNFDALAFVVPGSKRVFISKVMKFPFKADVSVIMVGIACGDVLPSYAVYKNKLNFIVDATRSLQAIIFKFRSAPVLTGILSLQLLPCPN